jgi:hypothetical protein
MNSLRVSAGFETIAESWHLYSDVSGHDDHRGPALVTSNDSRVWRIWGGHFGDSPMTLVRASQEESEPPKPSL